MKILILNSGNYGALITNSIKKHGNNFDIVGIHDFKVKLADDEKITDLIPENIEKADLLISIGLFSDINLIIPEIAKVSCVKSIIMPLSYPKQFPNDLESKIKSMLPDINIVFPKPFCSLTPQGDQYIDEFCQVFGKPEVKIDFNDKINKVEVIRSSPCGATWHVAENLVGISTETAESEAGNRLHNHTCLSSMAEIPEIGDSLLHLARYNSRESIKRALGFTCLSAVVDEDVCEGSEVCEKLCLKICPREKVNVETVTFNDKGKSTINPVTCGVCELCIEECPYGAIEVFKGRIEL